MLETEDAAVPQLQVFVKGSRAARQVDVLTRIRPNGVRQPTAEAWVLIKLNMQLLGNAPQNDRNYWP